jgi:hypothetical protein
MVQRGFCGVNSRSTSQALSRVVEVAQGVFLRIIFAFGFRFEERPLISCDTRCLDFALLTIDTVFITHFLPVSKSRDYIPQLIVMHGLDFKSLLLFRFLLSAPFDRFKFRSQSVAQVEWSSSNAAVAHADGHDYIARGNTKSVLCRLTRSFTRSSFLCANELTRSLERNRIARAVFLQPQC